MDDGFGHWLAGFIDGEGSFYLVPRQRRTAAGVTYIGWSCQFSIGLRSDDAPILHTIAATTGIGRVYERDRGARGLEARWDIKSRDDCAALVKVLDTYPLRAKKAADFIVWRRAVELHATLNRGGARTDRHEAAWAEMSRLRDALVAGRSVNRGTLLAVA